MNEESEDGYLSQQIHKLYADVITNYEADYILHIDSDTLFTRPVTPRSFFTGDRLDWYYTPYENTETPWKPITEKFVRTEVKNEFMRRLPMMIPKWLYPFARENCLANHQVSLGDYIKAQPYREFSEFNVLGALAWIHFHDKFEWFNTLTFEMPLPFARQFYSWGGLTDEVKAEIQTILNGETISGTEIPAHTPTTQQVHPNSLPVVESSVPDHFNPQDLPSSLVRVLARILKARPSQRQNTMRYLKQFRTGPSAEAGEKRNENIFCMFFGHHWFKVNDAVQGLRTLPVHSRQKPQTRERAG